MIPEVERYQGVVFRQLLVGHGEPLRLSVVDLMGRVDAFSIEGAAFQVKHSSKRLSPWQFTYMPENLFELHALAQKYSPVWVMLVCGIDGVVCLSLDELNTIAGPGETGTAWVRVSRSRNSMYHVGGSIGDLPRAKARGVDPFLTAVFPGRRTTQQT